MDFQLKRSDVLEAIRKWQAKEITSSELVQWSENCRQKWEDDEISMEDEDSMLDVLYYLSFADWMDSVPEEKHLQEEDYSLSSEEIQDLIEKLQIKS